MNSRINIHSNIDSRSRCKSNAYYSVFLLYNREEHRSIYNRTNFLEKMKHYRKENNTK